jgi:hypothetical protein
LAGDEPIGLGGIEPLDCSSFKIHAHWANSDCRTIVALYGE